MKPPLKLAAGLLGISMLSGSALAQQAPATGPGGYVTREEYDRLQQQMQAMQKQMEEMKKTQTDQQAEVDQTIEDIQKDITRNHNLIGSVTPGFTNFLLAGDAAVGFTAQRHSPSTFSAGFAPLFLWRINERVLFEGALDIGVDTLDTGESETTVDLTIANISYIVNDYLVVGGGLFVVPFGVYHNHFDPPWIDQFPDEPLPFGDGGLAPSSQLGFYATGGIPVGSTRLVYAAYISNGPSLITNDPEAAGSLDFENYTDLNSDKAYGGRIGWLPIPELELGYSVMYAQVSPEGFENADAWLQAVDGNFRKELAPIYGVLNVRGEWVWSHVAKTPYGGAGSGFERIDFRNNRQGGYAQVAYRPTMVSGPVIKNLELAVRFDWLTAPLQAPGGDHERRWTVALDYWVTPSLVAKLAYEFDHKQQGESADALLMQVGIGL